MRIRLITEQEDLYFLVPDFDDMPDVIIYGRSAFVWSNIAHAYMEKSTYLIKEEEDGTS